MRHELPEGYYVEKTGSRRVLYENAVVMRPVPGGMPEIKESDVRRVASFPREVLMGKIAEVARLDQTSRNPQVTDATRHNALWNLAEIFQPQTIGEAA